MYHILGTLNGRAMEEWSLEGERSYLELLAWAEIAPLSIR